MKNNRFNLTLTFLLVLVMTVCLSVAAPAVDVSFDDGQLIAIAPGQFTDADLFDTFKNVMPGDTLTEKLEISNNTSECDYIKVYLKAVLHDEEGNPISDEVLEELTADERRGETPELEYMHDFLSQLNMKVMNGEEEIYSDSPDKTDGLTEGVYLGSLRKGGSIDLDVELTVPIELDSKYMNRIGEVDWTFTVEGFDDPTPPKPPIFYDTVLTVRKVWDDDGIDRPDSVTVELLKNKKPVDEVKLSDKNQWTYTWDHLSWFGDWSVREKVVPDGYEVSYVRERHLITVINTEIEVPKIPEEPGTPAIPDLPEPIDEQEEPELPELPKSPEQPEDEAIVSTVDLTVEKRWDDTDSSKRPESVKVTLYNGETVIETVMLGAWNDWSYTWRGLDENGSWQIIETDIPKGYVPYYMKDGGKLVITNTATLIQTGQLSWPIPVLTAIGVLLVAYGVYTMSKKRKNCHA